MVARFILRRREVVCRRMNAAPVIENFDVIEDFVFRLLSGAKAFVVDELILQDTKETLSYRIVESSFPCGSYFAGSPMPRVVL